MSPGVCVALQAPTSLCFATLGHVLPHGVQPTTQRTPCGRCVGGTLKQDRGVGQNTTSTQPHVTRLFHGKGGAAGAKWRPHPAFLSPPPPRPVHTNLQTNERQRGKNVT